MIFGVVGEDEKTKKGIKRAMAETQPLPRAGEARDIARTAAWLASDAADYVTGQAITVDGGESLGPRWSEQFVK